MKAWALVLTTAAVLTGCGPNGTNDAQPGGSTASQSMRPTQHTADAKFLSAVAMYENYQVQAAAIAQTQGQSQAIKDYAARAATAHRATLQALTQAAQASGMAAPSGELNEDYHAYLAQLQAQNSIPFDTRYAAQQSLLTMSTAGRYDAFTTTAPDSGLRRWAASHNQAVHDDISAARQLAADIAR